MPYYRQLGFSKLWKAEDEVRARGNRGCGLLSILPLYLPADSLQVVHIDSLAAALAKLNLKIPIEDLITPIHEEDEAKRVKVTAEATQRRAAPSERKSAPHWPHWFHSLPAL